MKVTEQKVLPKKRFLGKTFYPIPKFSAAEVAFGAKESRYFDRHSSREIFIPEKYRAWATELFFKGGSIQELQVDLKKATEALRALMSSYAPPHESKEATVAYALWVWDTPEIWKD